MINECRRRRTHVDEFSKVFTLVSPDVQFLLGQSSRSISTSNSGGSLHSNLVNIYPKRSRRKAYPGGSTDDFGEIVEMRVSVSQGDVGDTCETNTASVGCEIETCGEGKLTVMSQERQGGAVDQRQ